MGEKKFISVILPLKLGWEPCYSISDEEVAVGDRVRVNFAHKEYLGVVSKVGIEPEMEVSKVKEIEGVERGLERILPQEISLWRSVASYYLCSIGEVYKAAYPLLKINQEEAKARAEARDAVRRENTRKVIQNRIDKVAGRIEKKREMQSKAKKESTREKYRAEAEALEGEKARLIQLLASAMSNEKPGMTGAAGMGGATEMTGAAGMGGNEISPKLSEAQSNAYREIKKSFTSGKTVLLHGVTGSGKTEIYIRLALEAIAKRKNVLYLVPEIALSRQLEDRLSHYFADRLHTFHSGETASDKRKTTSILRNTTGNIILGTRSSLFLPHHNLGLIIVDEEQDNSYKQDSPAPRYNGRDTALMLAQQEKCNIILGSATPSLESIYNCETGKYQLVELTEKFHGAEDADIEIIDTKAERRKRGMAGNFSIKLIERIRKTAEAGGQTIILCARRAYSPVLHCTNCGNIPKCPHCNVSLSYHKWGTGSEAGMKGKMVCHHCGYTSLHTGSCNKCGGELIGFSAGTQKIEEELKQLFPALRIARLDSDTASSKSYESRTIKSFSKGELDILIGTQIIAKGFDFSKLSLVAVIAADTLLSVQDFRADERAVQLLEQLRGRSGRREEKGQFVIQTAQPEHPVYAQLFSGRTEILNANLLQERKDFCYPPYSRIINLIIKDIYEDRANRMASRLAFTISSALRNSNATATPIVTGPYSPAVDKIADHHIRIIRISINKNRHLASNKAAVYNIVNQFIKKEKYERISIDVDPS